jgi:hypothetical protein
VFNKLMTGLIAKVSTYIFNESKIPRATFWQVFDSAVVGCFTYKIRTYGFLAQSGILAGYLHRVKMSGIMENRAM